MYWSMPSEVKRFWRKERLASSLFSMPTLASCGRSVRGQRPQRVQERRERPGMLRPRGRYGRQRPRARPPLPPRQLTRFPKVETLSSAARMPLPLAVSLATVARSSAWVAMALAQVPEAEQSDAAVARWSSSDNGIKSAGAKRW
jgi:hypothetical protein